MPRDFLADRESPSPTSQEVEELGPGSVMPELQSEEEMGGPRIAGLGPHDATSIMARLLEEDFAMEREIPDDVPQSMKDLHPYATTLSLQHVESCLKLENAAFPENLRASRDKIIYRLTRCGECCFGIFTSASPANSSSEHLSAPTAEDAPPPDSFSPERKGVLLAHIIATRSTNETVHDDDMALPEWFTSKTAPPAASSTAAPGESIKGHNEAGRTICIHSLATLPSYQGRGLGSTLTKAYVQRMVGADIADRVSLLAEEHNIKFYEKLGFENRGISKNATYGGAKWYDLVLDLGAVRAEEEEEEEEDVEEIEEIEDDDDDEHEHQHGHAQGSEQT